MQNHVLMDCMHPDELIRYIIGSWKIVRFIGFPNNDSATNSTGLKD